MHSTCSSAKNQAGEILLRRLEKCPTTAIPPKQRMGRSSQAARTPPAPCASGASPPVSPTAMPPCVSVRIGSLSPQLRPRHTASTQRREWAQMVVSSLIGSLASRPQQQHLSTWHRWWISCWIQSWGGLAWSPLSHSRVSSGQAAATQGRPRAQQQRLAPQMLSLLH